MAEKVDGTVRIDTSIDVEGLKKEIKELLRTIENFSDDSTRSIEQVDKTIDKTVDTLSGSVQTANSETQKFIEQWDNLNAKIEVQQKQLSNLQREYARVVERQGENSDAALKLQNRILNVEGSIRKMIDASDNMAEKFHSMAQKSSEEIKEIGTQSKKSADISISAGDVIKDSFNKIGISVDGLIDGVQAYQDEMENAATTGTTKVGAISNAFSMVALPAVAAVVGEVVNLCNQMAEATEQSEFFAAKMSVLFDLTEEEAEAVADSVDRIYNDGFAESKEQAQSAMISVMRLLNLTGDEAEETAKKIVGVATVTGKDTEQLTQAVAQIMRVFEVDATNALDMVSYGLKNGADDAGDFLDVIVEYAPAWKRMGYSAAEAMDAIASGLDAGAKNADKVSDLVKEVYNKAADGSDDFKNALKELGVGADGTINSLLSGGDKAQDAFQRIIDKLASMSNTTKQSQLASRILGTQWEDTSTNVAKAITDINNSVENYGNTAEDILNKVSETATIKNNETSRELEGFWNDWGKYILHLIGFGWVNEAVQSIRKLTGGYATGTLSASRGVKLVGERGPELVYFNGGERVDNAMQTMAKLSTLGQNSVVNNITNNYEFRVDNIDTYAKIERRLKTERMSYRQGYIGR